MDPNQNSPGGVVPGPANQYEFITNPAPQQKKKGLIPKLGGGSLTQKLILIVGGAVILMLLMWVFALIFGGSNVNIDNAVGLTQSEQEMIRVSEEGSDATSQAVRNFAANMNLTMKTQQRQWFTFLQERGRTVGTAELSMKQSADTDQRLQIARQSNTFDHALTQILENQLRAYAIDLDNAFNATSHQTERALLSEHYSQVQLLLKQVPNR